MEIEPWWLLALPLFFALGWLAARIDLKQLIDESRRLPRSYFAGLNFLLNEQPDRAIDAFLEAARATPDTVELHFALGNLFRRRGEIDRAIRIHRHLLERAETLSEEQRLAALAELGHDYLKAGLLDRAEETFLELRMTARHEEALRALLEIYQQEKEWRKALRLAQEMPSGGSHLWQREIAHFHCELAERAIVEGRHEEAEDELKAALSAHRQCARATLLSGQLAARRGDLEEALKIWQRIEQQNPAYLALAAPDMLGAWRALGREREGVHALKHYLERYPSLDLLDLAFEAALAGEGVEAAYLIVKNELRRNPTLSGLDRLLEAQVLLAPPERRHDLELIKSLIHHHTRRIVRYRCQECGFKARQFHWRCPACASWESFPPCRHEELEAYP
ncbi:MAG: lipopolysaccharide assembly protein LapB [Rhodocyclaceae bacterium]|nr:lipopolysaccharide assembly protein LapB [Rhodocyclaceae bacterium]